MGGLAPGLTAAIEVFFERELRLDENGPRAAVRPEGRVAVLAAARSSAVADLGTAQFQLLAARLDGCPVALDAGPAWVLFGRMQVTLRPCAALTAGTLEGSGHAGGYSATKLRPWITVDAIARIQLTLLDYFALEAQLGAMLPLVRDSFTFEAGDPSQPATTIYAVPAVGGWIGGGASIRFP